MNRMKKISLLFPILCSLNYATAMEKSKREKQQSIQLDQSWKGHQEAVAKCMTQSEIRKQTYKFYEHGILKATFNAQKKYVIIYPTGQKKKDNEEKEKLRIKYKFFLQIITDMALSNDDKKCLEDLTQLNKKRHSCLVS